MARSGRFGYWAAIGVAVAAVGVYYLWQLRSAGYSFDWSRDQSGYYNYLGRAFAKGRLALPIEPLPALLALPNPWDPAANEPYRMHDMAFYRGRYYLYHGAGPAVMVFGPWRVVTGRDVSERFALFLFCFGGFAFSCGTLLRWLVLAGAKPAPPWLFLMLLALGVCQSVPFLLSRVWVYEVAIGAGYFCISAATFLLARGIESRWSTRWLAVSGAMFGMAVACRPHLILAGAIATIGLAVLLSRSRGLRSALVSREFAAFAGALVLAGFAIAVYNYRRFDDPFEFGLRYLLAGPNQNRLRMAWANILPGLYFWLACPPDLSPVFPWVRLAFRYPFNSPSYGFPPEYFIEGTFGALFLAPFVVAAGFVPGARVLGKAAVRVVLWTAAVSAATILLFLTATGFTTQRYEVDFLPMVVLVAIANLAIHIDRSQGLARAALQCALMASIACGMVVSMAFGISGPYDEMLKNRPRSYLRIARWFSPVEEYRLVMNPEIDVRFTAEFGPRQERVREPLVTIGRGVYEYFLYTERGGGRLRFVSRTEASTVTRDVEETARAGIRLVYAAGKISVTVDGLELLVHDVGTLVTAPSQVTVGENRVEANVTAPRFLGTIRDVVKTVRAN